MSGKPKQKTSHVAIGHPIRVVPLHRPELAAAAAPAAQLTYRNGPLLTAVEVFTIFWGSDWQQSPQSLLIPRMNQFFDFILSSALLDQLSEYSVPGKSIGPGKRTGTFTLTTPVLKTSLQDAAIQKMMGQEISAGTLPGPTTNSLYFIFLPPGIKVLQGGSASCQSFCGYHDAIVPGAVAGADPNIYYAVMPYPGCSGCTGGLSLFDALTSTTSHELCEAITDPVPGQGWYDDTNGEIGDICAWKTRPLGAYTIQLEWSNKASSCI